MRQMIRFQGDNTAAYTEVREDIINPQNLYQLSIRQTSREEGFKLHRSPAEIHLPGIFFFQGTHDFSHIFNRRSV